MRMTIFASLVVVAACDTPVGAGAVPVSARLDSTGLFVTLDNGEVCEGISPVGRGVMEWSHELDGCSLSAAYSAMLLATPPASEPDVALTGRGPLRYDPVPGAMSAMVMVYGNDGGIWKFTP